MLCLIRYVQLLNSTETGAESEMVPSKSLDNRRASSNLNSLDLATTATSLDIGDLYRTQKGKLPIFPGKFGNGKSTAGFWLRAAVACSFPSCFLILRAAPKREKGNVYPSQRRKAWRKCDESQRERYLEFESSPPDSDPANLLPIGAPAHKRRNTRRRHFRCICPSLLPATVTQERQSRSLVDQ